MQTEILALTPEFVVLASAMLALFVDRFGRDRAAAVVGVIGCIAAAVLVWVIPMPTTAFGSMLDFGKTAAAADASATLRSSLAVLTALFLVWVAARGWIGAEAREAVSMALFSTMGSMLLVLASDIVMLFMALELATMPTYVLIGYARGERRSLEGAMKFFLLSLLTSLVMAYGLSFVFGLTGGTSYVALDFEKAGALAVLAGVLVFVGFLGKITAAPFQWWSPDASEGASVPAVAYIATIAKIAPVFALARFFAVVLPDAGPALVMVVLVAAVASMVLGNLTALPQTDLRRMISYAGVASAGYILLGFLSTGSAGLASAVFYAVVYAVGTLGMMLVVAQEGATLQDVAGLVNRRPYAAWTSVLFLFSIIGFPPMVGFYGKIALFSAALDAGYLWVVMAAVLLSVVSAGYAFNVLRAMFTPGEGAPEAVERPSIEETATYAQRPVLAGSVIMTLAVLTLGLGLIAEPLIKLLGAALLNA